VSVSRFAGFPHFGQAQLTKSGRLFSGLPLPSGTRFLVVHIRFNRTRPEPTATPITFAGCYVDDVKAELLLRPAANVAAENSAQ
jgi:hypothetical protein